MMRLGTPRHGLGLALGQGAIDVALVRGNGEAKVIKSATFTLAEHAWDKPEALGAALRLFLQEQGIGARDAVVGLPASWLLTRALPVPPADQATAVQMARLAVERDFHADLRDWVFDLAGSASATQATTLLLTGARRQRVEAVTTAVTAAGLRLRAITATSLALVAGAEPQDDQAATLLVTREGAELSIVSGGRVVALAPLPTGELAASLSRALAVAAMKEEQGARTLTVWNAAGVDSSALRALGQAGLQVRSEAAVGGLGKLRGPEAAPAALALLATSGRRAPVNLLQSRLAVARQRLLTRPRALAGGAAALLLLIVLALAGDWYVQRRAVTQLQRQLVEIKKPLEAAKAELARVRMAQGWFDQRPPLLDCLRALTLAMPESGSVYATSLSARDDLTGTLAGKAGDEQAVLEVLERMKRSGRFQNVKLLYLRQGERGNRGVSFALTFAFVAES